MTTILPLLLLFCCSISADFSVHPPKKSTLLEESNYYLKSCTFSRQCDESYGYVCRDGKCSCKFGKPDVKDQFKCKVQVKLGDFCKEVYPKSKNSVYIRRKCPHNSVCSGICVCSDLYERRKESSSCVPKILLAGGKPCRDHVQCMTQRGQQCYNNTCVECSVGRFKNFRVTNKWVEAKPECTCFEEVANNSGTNSFRHKKGHSSCTPQISTGDHCTISKNCVSPWTPQLSCLEGTCQCPPGSKEFKINNLETLCIVPINSHCSSVKDCHSPTSYCETRLEVPVCKCKDGYEESGRDTSCISRYYEETCGQFYPQNDKLREHLKEQRLSCIQGIYECARPRDMFWDRERGKCVSLVGGRCDLDLFDLSGCAGESRCWEYKSLGEFRCQCPLQEMEEEGKYDKNRNSIKKNSFGTVRFKASRDRRICEAIT